MYIVEPCTTLIWEYSQEGLVKVTGVCYSNQNITMLLCLFYCIFLSIYLSIYLSHKRTFSSVTYRGGHVIKPVDVIFYVYSKRFSVQICICFHKTHKSARRSMPPYTLVAKDCHTQSPIKLQVPPTFIDRCSELVFLGSPHWRQNKLMKAEYRDALRDKI